MIKRIQRSREVRLQLEDAIRRGDFAPGERLPSERELVATFGVSRVSVREAMRSLEAIGRIKVEHGRGAFVTDRLSGFGESMTGWLEQHRDEVAELHAVRGALDVLAVEEAVRHFNPDHVAAIVAAQEAFAGAVDGREELWTLVELDIAFHSAIAEASGNRLLRDLLSDLHVYLAEARCSSFSRPDRAAKSAAEHHVVVKAVVRGDVDAAGQAMRRHLISSTGALAAAAQALNDR